MGNKNSLIDAKVQAMEWQWQLKSELKHLDKEINKIEAEESKLRKEIEKQAALGKVDNAHSLARQVVRTRKAVDRLEKTKVSMHAVVLQLTTSIATMTTANSLRISADMMARMNTLAKTPELGMKMEQMRQEMARCAEADDRLEEVFRVPNESEEADAEVQKVFEELALDQLGPLAIARSAAPAVAPTEPLVRQLVAARQMELAGPTAGGLAPVAPMQMPTPGVAPSNAPTPAVAPSAVPSNDSHNIEATLDAFVPPKQPVGRTTDDDLMQRLARLKQ